TPAPVRSPANPANASSSRPATCTTTASSTPSPDKPSPPYAARRAPAPTTTTSAAAAPDIRPRYANSATASSGSCTAASRPAPRTTKTPLGRTTNKINKLPLDNKKSWGVYPNTPERWVSHETIYQAIYFQARGRLRQELARQVA